MKLRTLLLATAAAGLLSSSFAMAEDYLGGAVKSAEVGGKTILTDAKDMTLYIWDKDAVGVSNCYEQCAVNWPPILVPADTAVRNSQPLRGSPAVDAARRTRLMVTRDPSAHISAARKTNHRLCSKARQVKTRIVGRFR